MNVSDVVTDFYVASINTVANQINYKCEASKSGLS